MVAALLNLFFILVETYFLQDVECFIIFMLFVSDIYPGHLQDPAEELKTQCPGKDVALAVQGYAVGFLKYNSSLGIAVKVEAPATPDRISDLGIQDMSWEDHLTEVCNLCLWFLLKHY